MLNDEKTKNVDTPYWRKTFRTKLFAGQDICHLEFYHFFSFTFFRIDGLMTPLD